MRPRWHDQPDAITTDIVTALRKCGASVSLIQGEGVPDLLVGFRGVTYLVEVKKPLGPKGGASMSGQALRPSQVVWRSTWRGAQALVIRSVEDALDAIVRGLRPSSS